MSEPAGTATPTAGVDLALELTGIEKRFFGVRVLKEVSLAVRAGRLLGLVGENGAGKSTLMNILGGALVPEAGAMRLFDRPYRPRHPHDAGRAGIAFIHQELNLFANLTLAENLFLTAFPRRSGWIQRAAMHSRARALLDEVGLKLPPDLPLERLSAGERQLVEIAKALSVAPRLLILDEPTTSLTAHETEHLFALLARLRARGLTMIYISHALNDVLRLCDDVVVLRDGEVVGRGPRPEFTIDRMIQLMVGRKLEQLFPERRGAVAQTPALEVRHLSQPGIVRDISFRVRHGEVVGLAGLMGSGRTELARMLFGLDPMSAGTLELDGAPIGHLSPRERIARGLAFLTESRREEGLCMDASIAENLALVALPRAARGRLGWLNRRALDAQANDIRAAVRLTATARNESPVKTLSGGNQQKVVLAKWLLNEPKVFLLDEPTRGIDVGAKHEVYALIRQQAERGAGVLVISSEIEELIGLCDRILVMHRGELRDELRRDEFDRERILRSALQGRAISAADPPETNPP